MLINIGLGHLGWEILPGRSCLGPWARAHGPMQQQHGPRAQGPRALLLHGPGPLGPCGPRGPYHIPGKMS